MAIRALSQQEFDRFGTRAMTDANVPGTQVEWFADDSGTMIGIIIRGASDREWACATFRRRDHLSTFRARDLISGFSHVDDARRLLFQKIAVAVPAQDDGRTDGCCRTDFIS